MKHRGCSGKLGTIRGWEGGNHPASATLLRFWTENRELDYKSYAGNQRPLEDYEAFNQIIGVKVSYRSCGGCSEQSSSALEPSQHWAQGALPVGMQMREKGRFSGVSCGSPKKLPAGHTREAVTQNDPQTGRWHCHVFAIKIVFAQVKRTWILYKALASSHLYTHINNTRGLCIYIFDT